MGPHGDLVLAGDSVQPWWMVTRGGRLAELAVRSATTGTPMLDPQGRALLMSQTQVVRVERDGSTTVLAGSGCCELSGEPSRGYTGEGGAATAARLCPSAAAAGRDGRIAVIDRAHARLLSFFPGGVIRTLAGTGQEGDGGDGGPATAAELNHPGAVAVQRNGGVLFVDQWGSVVRRVTPDGRITRVAGGGHVVRRIDGRSARDLDLREIASLAAGPDGAFLFVAGPRVIRVDRNGIVSTVAGRSVRGCGSGSGSAVAQGRR